MTDAPAPTGLHEDLLRRFRTGRDPQALARLFDLAAPPLFRVALAVAPEAASAEEAVQETFLALLEDPDRPDLSRPLMAWMTAVVRHKVIDARRRAARKPDPLSVEPRLVPEDPADAAARVDARDRVRAAIAALPEPYRTVAVLRWEYGLEPAEIAHARGEPPGTVRSNLSRALERLRASLGGVTALALVLGVRPPQGLAAVRRRVLEHAGVPAATIGLHVGGMAVSATAAALALAGAFVAGTLATAAAVALLAPAAPHGAPASTGSDDQPVVAAAHAARAHAATGPAVHAPADRGDAGPRDRDDADVTADAPVSQTVPASPPGVDMTDGTVRRDAHRLLDGMRTSFLEGWRVGRTLSAMRPAETVVSVLRERWASIPGGVERQNILKGFAWDATCERRLDVFSLGLDDRDPRVQDFATHYVSPYAGRDLTGDPAAAREWLRSVAGADPDALLDASADSVLASLRQGDAADRPARLALLATVVAKRRTPRVVDAVLASASVWIEDTDWLADPAPVLGLIAAARPSDVWAASEFEALLVRGGAHEERAMRLAGRLRIRAAWNAVASRAVSADAALAATALGALAAYDDARAIAVAVQALDGPTPVAAIETLETLTLMSSFTGRDAAWWRTWWNENRSRYELPVPWEDVR